MACLASLAAKVLVLAGRRHQLRNALGGGLLHIDAAGLCDTYKGLVCRCRSVS